MSKAGKGLDGLLSDVAQKKTSRQSSIPTVPVPAQLSSAVFDLIVAQREEEAAKSSRKIQEQKLLDFAEGQRREQSVRAGQLFASLKLLAERRQKDKEGKETEETENAAITFTQQARFLQMKVADGARDIIQGEFGDSFDNYFAVRPQFTISDDLNEEDVEKLAAALRGSVLAQIIEWIENRGKKNAVAVLDAILDLCREQQDDLTRLVTANPIVKPNPQLVNDMIFNDVVSARTKALQQQGLCKLIAPSFSSK